MRACSCCCCCCCCRILRKATLVRPIARAKGSPFGGAQMEAMQAEMAANVAAAQASAAAQVEQQMQALRAQSSDELVAVRAELADVQSRLAAAHAVAEHDGPVVRVVDIFC